ncbi:MAG: site-specific integrase [Actinobacteria bacterium]|jgi:integrase|nr:site-specific integrase [Actinomycetota bacterium]
MPPSRTRRRFGRIRRLPSGRYQASYIGPDGIVHNADKTFATKAMAERWLSLTEADMVRGEWSAPERRAETVGEWAERWLEQGQWRPTTAAGYKSKVRTLVLPRWSATPIGEVRREDVRAWATGLADDGFSSASIRHAAGTLGRILDMAVESGALVVNPCARLRLRTPRQSEITPLTVDEVEALASAIERPEFPHAGHGAGYSTSQLRRPDLALWVRLAAYCGLRAGELGALRRGRIDLDGRTLRVEESLADSVGTLSFGPPKSGKARSVPLPATLIPALRRHLASRVEAGATALVFTDRDGGPIRHGNLYRRHFRPAVERAGLSPNLRFHDLRHTYAALLIAAGAHPRAIMERMGHSSITVTLGTYGHLLPSVEQEVAARLDDVLGSASRHPATIARILHGAPRGENGGPPEPPSD